MDIVDIIDKMKPIVKVFQRGDSRELMTLENAIKTIKYQKKIDRIDNLIAQRKLRPEGLEEAAERISELHPLMDTCDLVHPEVERLEALLELCRRNK